MSMVFLLSRNRLYLPIVCNEHTEIRAALAKYKLEILTDQEGTSRSDNPKDLSPASAICNKSENLLTAHNDIYEIISHAVAAKVEKDDGTRHG